MLNPASSGATAWLSQAAVPRGSGRSDTSGMSGMSAGACRLHKNNE